MAIHERSPGSLFTVTNANLTGGSEQPSTERPHKVLIVESSVKELQQLAAAFRRLGFEPMEATTLEAGKRLWTAHQPPVLIADIRLGQFNGLQLLMHARSERPDVRAVITCAFPDRVLEAEAHRFGGVFMVKPVTAADLLATLGISPDQPILSERRVAERRQTTTSELPDERRVGDRRGPTGS
jgi:DNA-binding NtrC family response regulator